MYFGMFGSIFLLAQFFQVVQGYSPFQAGLRTLPWTIMPIFVAPVAGLLVGRGPATRPLIVARPWRSRPSPSAGSPLVTTPTVDYVALVPAFIIGGIGMGLFFAPIANVVLSAVRPDEEGKASGANNAIREVGGVFGVAVLASIFSANGSYASRPGLRRRDDPGAAAGRGRRRLGAVVGLAIGGRPRTAVDVPERVGRLGGVRGGRRRLTRGSATVARSPGTSPGLLRIRTRPRLTGAIVFVAAPWYAARRMPRAAMPSTSVWSGRVPAMSESAKWPISATNVSTGCAVNVCDVPSRSVTVSDVPSGLCSEPRSPTTEKRSVTGAGVYAQLVTIWPTTPLSNRTSTCAESSPSMNVSRCVDSIAVASIGVPPARWSSRYVGW